MKEIYLRIENCQDKESLHSHFSGELNFPAWYGSNLDALHDILTDAREDIFIVVPDTEALEEKLGGYFRQLMRVLLDSSAENHHIHLVTGDVTEVVAALIWDGDRFMACQRPAHKARGLLWEFVGGKVEPGESKENALIRECREELSVTISVGEVFMDVIHEYPDLTVHLTLYNATIAEGEPQALEHNDIRWITTEEIDDYPFCPADDEILKRLKQLK